MKANEFAIGVFFLIVGFLIFWHGYSTLLVYQSSAGALALAFSEEAVEQYVNAQIESVLGGLLALGGFVASLYGAVSQVKEEKVKPRRIEYERHGLTWKRKTAQPPEQAEESVSQETKEPLYCPYCEEKLPSHAVYCLKCGKKIE